MSGLAHIGYVFSVRFPPYKMLWRIFVTSVIVFTYKPTQNEAFYLDGSSRSHAIYPKWNACVNATISFEFRTTQSEGLLMYVDDGGKYDFIEVMHRLGRVEVVLNIVNEQDDNVEIVPEVTDVNDGEWHRVEIRRKRMDTIVIVDDVESSRYSFGSDFHFGDPDTNSYVYFGGLPQWYDSNWRALALPSVVFQQPFKGAIRNVMYSNCTCQTTRAPLLGGVEVDESTPESCDVNNPCQEGCLCVSTDAESLCDCSERQCFTGTIVHYRLPMDVLYYDTTLRNPSGLDAKTFGGPLLIPGVQQRALRLEGPGQYAQVAGPGHRFECFGDLDKCNSGHTMSFWVNFLNPTDSETIYLTNGGHTSRCHGVAMTYDRGHVKFQFRKRGGEEWVAEAKNVLPGRWYHVTSAWREDAGLSVYIDGKREGVDASPVTRSPGDVDTSRCQEFLLGRPNDNSAFDANRTVLFDEFNFWSTYKTPDEVKEIGPFYKYEVPMEGMSGGQMSTPDPAFTLAVGGEPSLIASGKIGNALQLNGRNQYLDGGDQAGTCLGDLDTCLYGVTMGAWVQFSDMKDNSVIMDTGSKGLKVYYDAGGQLIAEAQAGDQHWQASYDGELQPDKWYFIEASWEPSRGLDLWVDLENVASSASPQTRPPASGPSRLLIGRANGAGGGNTYASMLIDQFMVAYGDRQRLINFNVIARGRPQRQYFAMNEINGNRLASGSLPVVLHGNPRVVRGQIAGALNLNGNGQYANFGAQAKSCMGNLDRCPHGVLWGSWFRPGQLTDNMELMSAGVNGLKMHASGGNLVVTASTTTRQWQLNIANLRPDLWYFLEVGWHPVQGLALYLNNSLVASTNRYTERPRADLAVTTRGQNNFYVGRGDGRQQGMRYGSLTIDDMEYWYGHRDYLLAFDYLQRGAPDHLLITMDRLRDGKIAHESLNLPVYGGARMVPGRVGNALRLNGNSQYLDIGRHGDSCLGDLERCRHGVTGSMWLNFARFENDMYYYANGGGMRIFHKNGQLYFVFESQGKQWEVHVPYVPENTWQFVEYTWHPDKGLRVYLNNVLQGHSQLVRVVPEDATDAQNRVYLGRANPTDDPRFKFGDFTVDQFETWFSDRDYLVAWGYIFRDNVTHLTIPFEDAVGDAVVHPVLKHIRLVNGATLRPAHAGNGVHMGGSGEYVTLGTFPRQCLGSLEHCPFGVTLTMHVMPRELSGPRDTYFLSSRPYDVYYKDGKLVASFRTATREWIVSSDQLRADEWSRVDVSWDAEEGLQLYVNDTLVDETNVYESYVMPPSRDDNVYVGRPHNPKGNGRYLNGMVDELEVWYANRNHLESVGLINRGTQHLILTMDEIQNDRLVHSSGRHTFDVHNGATVRPAVIAGGVYLNGDRQFVSADGGVVCGGRLESCTRGLTLRYKIRPLELEDDTYFVSSAPLDVYYKDGRLWAEARTAKHVWRVNTQSLLPDAWNQLDVSWDPVGGLRLYHNGRVVDSQIMPQPNTEAYDVSRDFYIGRHDSDVWDGHYPTAVIDDFQIWQAKRDYLVANDYIDTDPEPGRSTRPQPPPTTTTARPGWPDLPRYTGPDKVLVYNGNAWSSYDLSDFPANFLGLCGYEQFVVKFMTSEPSGLLWYTGNPGKNMHLGFKNGDVVLKVEYGSHTDRFQIQTGYPLNDNQWHKIVVTRRARTLTVNVDGSERSQQLSDDIVMRQQGQLLLGGSPNPRRTSGGEFRTNFDGSIDEALLRCDNNDNQDVNLNELFVVKDRPGYVDGINVEIIDYVQPTPSPSGVHFRRPDSYLRHPRLEMLRGGTLEGRFRTLQDDALLLYNGPEAGHSDFLLLELHDGRLYLLVDLGNGPHRLPFPGPPTLDDGLEHHFRIERNGRQWELALDDVREQHTLPSRTDDDGELNLGTFLFLGGVANPDQLPWHAWTRAEPMYVGCLSDVRVNGDVSDLAMFTRDQFAAGVEEGCGELRHECLAAPCFHGTCRETVTGFYCDCADTPYTGSTCQEDAKNVIFDCTSRITATPKPTISSHTNDISLRFRTLKSNGLLFKTSNKFTQDSIKVSLENGRGRADVTIRGQKQTLWFCSGLDDNRWHTLYIARRANHVQVWADACQKATVDLGGSGYSLDVDEIEIGWDEDRKEECFVGNMQNLYFDKRDIFKPLSIDSRWPDTPPYNPVTFRERTYNYATLPTLSTDGDMHVQLMLKTTDGEGLLLYSDGIDGDFLALELVDGALQYVVDAGAGPRVFEITDKRLDDDKWHSIEIEQESRQRFVFTVDGTKIQADLSSGSNTLDLDSYLFVGGVPQDMYRSLPRQVFSRKGYAGCMATVRVMETLYDVIRDAEDITDFVTPGCGAYSSFCKDNPCRHFGVCVEGLTSFYCDCNMTSFVGDDCTEEAEGYRFMKQGGNRNRAIMTYNVNPNMDTSRDELAFGFMTYKPDGTLVRLDSGISADYIEAKLENGRVVVTYDIGDNAGPQRLETKNRVFSDGLYHYVTFRREEGKGWLRVDDYPVIENIPEKEPTVRLFNDLSVVKIGGDKDLEGNVINFFDGIIAGVYYNGTRITDMTRGISKEGDVLRAVHPFYLERPVTVPVIVVTPHPPQPFTQPSEPGVEYQPLDGHGGGVAWAPVVTGEGGDDAKVVGVEIDLQPGGGGVGIDDGGAGVIGVPPPVQSARVAAGADGGAGEGARAAGVAGALFGVLLLSSSLMWALYKFKPGLLGGAGGGGGGGDGGESATLLISGPHPVSNFNAMKAAGGGYGYGYGGPVKVDINGAAGMGAGEASVGTQTLQTMNSIDMSQFAAAGAAAGVSEFYYGGATASRATQTGLTGWGASLFHQTSASTVDGYGTWGAGAAATSTLVRESYKTSVYETTSDGHVYSAGGAAGGVVSVARAPRSTMEMGTMTVSNSGTQTDGDLASYDQVDYSDATHVTLSRDLRSASSAFNAINVAPPPAPPSYHHTMYSSSHQTQTNSDVPRYNTIQGHGYSSQGQMYAQGQGYGAAFNTMQNTRSAFTYNTQEARQMSANEMRAFSDVSSQLQGHETSASQYAGQYATNLFGSQMNALSQTAGVMMASEEIRVDCALLTQDGRYVVTGSIYGPPQVWDLRTGALVRIMEGEDFSSTDLHLAANDSLLVGQVAEMTPVEGQDPGKAARLHHRKLQIWDFETGTPLVMATSEQCTASALMSDGGRVVLGHTDKYGNGTTIVIWDLLGNELLRKIKYSASIGFADYISYLTLSRDNRYVIAGFQNSFDGHANFLVFDLTVADYDVVDPKILALDGVAECSAVLDNHEMVTGSRSGELIIWSMRTGKPLRQLVSPAPLPIGGALSLGRNARPAHGGEVKAVAITSDAKLLVSASRDDTLKVWNLETERLMFTLKGHTDEVWCCALSADDDMLVSGSRDGTIRLWRVQSGQHVCSFNTGHEIFSLRMSRDKRTVVALGEREGVRKLIMLRVVVTKVRSRAGSRATSPQSVTSDGYHFAPY